MLTNNTPHRRQLLPTSAMLILLDFVAASAEQEERVTPKLHPHHPQQQHMQHHTSQEEEPLGPDSLQWWMGHLSAPHMRFNPLSTAAHSQGKSSSHSTKAAASNKHELFAYLRLLSVLAPLWGEVPDPGSGKPSKQPAQGLRLFSV